MVMRWASTVIQITIVDDRIHCFSRGVVGLYLFGEAGMPPLPNAQLR